LSNKKILFSFLTTLSCFSLSHGVSSGPYIGLSAKTGFTKATLKSEAIRIHNIGSPDNNGIRYIDATLTNKQKTLYPIGGILEFGTQSLCKSFVLDMFAHFTIESRKTKIGSIYNIANAAGTLLPVNAGPETQNVNIYLKTGPSISLGARFGLFIEDNTILFFGLKGEMMRGRYIISGSYEDDDVFENYDVNIKKSLLSIQVAPEITVKHYLAEKTALQLSAGYGFQVSQTSSSSGLSIEPKIRNRGLNLRLGMSYHF